MLQNVYGAGVVRSADAYGLQLTPFKRMPVSLSKFLPPPNDPDTSFDSATTIQEVPALDRWVNVRDADPKQMLAWLKSMQAIDGAPEWLVPVREPNGVFGVHGALKELEKWVRSLGLRCCQYSFLVDLIMTMIM
jgi:hypothetical protein